MILGLDCSTNVAGVAFYNEPIVKFGCFIDTSKLDNNKEKIQYIISELDKMEHIKFITKINLEAPVLGFQRGKTSAQTIITLIRFNALLEYLLSEYYKMQVNLISANTARKKVLGKCFLKGVPAKEYVRNTLPKLHPEILTFDKLNRDGNWNVKNGDMYDAAVVAAYN